MFKKSDFLIKRWGKPKSRKMQDIDENVIIQSKLIKINKCLPFQNLHKLLVGCGAYVSRTKATFRLIKDTVYIVTVKLEMGKMLSPHFLGFLCSDSFDTCK